MPRPARLPLCPLAGGWQRESAAKMGALWALGGALLPATSGRASPPRGVRGGFGGRGWGFCGLDEGPQAPSLALAYAPLRLIRSRAHGGLPDFISALGDCVLVLVGNRVPLLLKREWSLKRIGLGIILAAALLSHSVAYIIYQTG